jgi:dTMP kinase
VTSEPAPFIPPSSEEPPLPPRPWEILANRPFRRLWAAQVLSSLGDWVGLFAILAIAARVSDNSAAAVSLVMVARVVPGFFLATIGGVLVDRVDRRKIMVAADVGRAGVIAVLPFVNTLPALVAASFLLEILTLLWGPAKDASVPHFVPQHQLASANSLGLVASYGTFPFGGVLFSALAVVATWLGGFEALSSLQVDQEVLALWVDAATYLASALLVLRLPIPGPARVGGGRVDLWATVHEVREGLGFIRHDRLARAVIVGMGGGLIGAGAMVPLGPVFANEVLSGSAQFGVLMTALGTGASIGVLGLVVVQRRLPRERVFPLATVGVGAFLMAAVTFNVGGLVALMVVGAGACAGAAYVSGFTVLQEATTDELRGRTFATLYTVIRLCLLLSLTVSPLFADLFHWVGGQVIPGRSVTLGGFRYTFPGVRWALWGGGAVTLAAGWYADRELRSLRRAGAATGSGAVRPEAATAGSAPEPPEGDDPRWRPGTARPEAGS